MAATPARIGFILQQFRRETVEDASNKAFYGTMARKSDDPVETFFSNTADAALAADARMDIVGRKARRFALDVKDPSELLELEYTGTLPVIDYVDDERSCRRTMIVTDITVDLAKNSATLGIWG